MLKWVFAMLIGGLLVVMLSGCAELTKYDNVPRQPMPSARAYQTSNGDIIVYDRYGNKVMETFGGSRVNNRR